MRTSKRYERASVTILEAALVRFERDGVAATRLTDVSRDVHMTRELIYYYYANKSALIEAAADVYASRIGEALAGIMRGDANVGDLVAVIRNLAYDGCGERTPMLRVLDEMGKTRRVVWSACEFVEDSDAPRLAFLIYGVLGLLEHDPLADASWIAAVASQAIGSISSV